MSGECGTPGCTCCEPNAIDRLVADAPLVRAEIERLLSWCPLCGKHHDWRYEECEADGSHLRGIEGFIDGNRDAREGASRAGPS